MSSSPLYAATVETWLQILPQVALFVDKAEAHCVERDLPPSALLDARLAPDMWTFSKQVMYTILSSAGAVVALRDGRTGPDLSDPPDSFAELRARVSAAIAVLKAATPEEIDRGTGGNVVFAFTGREMHYVRTDFLLSFSVPNFFFHAGMAYAILRNQGLNLGKRHFLGKVRAQVSLTG